MEMGFLNYFVNLLYHLLYFACLMLTFSFKKIKREEFFQRLFENIFRKNLVFICSHNLINLMCEQQNLIFNFSELEHNIYYIQYLSRPTKIDLITICLLLSLRSFSKLIHRFWWHSLGNIHMFWRLLLSFQQNHKYFILSICF